MKISEKKKMKQAARGEFALLVYNETKTFEQYFKDYPELGKKMKKEIEALRKVAAETIKENLI